MQVLFRQGLKAVEGNIVYKTKGDANNAEDNTETPQKDVMGKVLFSIPWLGYVIDFVKKPMGLMIVIVIPAVIIVYDQLQRIAREMKKLKSKVKKVEEEVEAKSDNVGSSDVLKEEFKDEGGEEVLFKPNEKNKE